MKDLIWKEIVKKINLKSKDKDYQLWLNHMKPLEIENEKYVIEVPNEIFSKWLVTSFKDEIDETFVEHLGKKLELEFKYKTDKKTTEEIEKKISEEIEEATSVFQLNPKYIFENFVKGPSNRFAYEISYAVAVEPGKRYNPVFIYSGVGLGKTHLLHAIGHQLCKTHSKAKLFYTSSEKFVSEVVDSIRDNKVTSFRDKFRRTDCLLIDDIQFLAGKQRSSEEFFFTFNNLYDSKKQIVITSDRPPKELPNIEERLISRFEWGVIADIKPPELETRIAILEKKRELEGFDISNDVLVYLATQIKDNIRVLEGALIRLAAFASIYEINLTVDNAKEILSEVLRIDEKEKIITVEKIQQVVASHFNISVEDLKSKTRTEEIALPRQIAMYLCRIFTDLSTIDIGEAFGGKEHPTVIHACRKIKHMMEREPIFANEVNKIIQKLKGK